MSDSLMLSKKRQAPGREKISSWRRILFVIGLGIGIFLFSRQVWIVYQDVRQQDFILSNPIYLVAGLVLCLLIYFLQMLAWTMVMRYLGVDLDLRYALQGYFMSFLPRYIPGSVWGYWGRSHWLEQVYNVDYATSLAGSALEALTLILTAFAVSMSYFFVNSTDFVKLVMALSFIGILGLTWLVMPKVVLRISRRLGREVKNIEREHYNSLYPWSIALILYLVFWVIYGSSVLLVGNALQPDFSRHLLGTTAAASLAWVLGFAAIVVPAGIGVRELTLSALLVSYANFHPWQANLVSIISRLGIILAELWWLAFGLGLFVRERWNTPRLQKLLSFQKKNNDKPDSSWLE